MFTGWAAAGYFSTLTAINGMAPILAPLIGFGDRSRGTAVGVTATCCLLIGVLTYLIAQRWERHTVPATTGQ